MQLTAIGGLLIAAYWVTQLALTIRKPADWRPAGWERLPFALTRDRMRLVSVIGIVAGLAVFVWGWFVMSGS